MYTQEPEPEIAEKLQVRYHGLAVTSSKEHSAERKHIETEEKEERRPLTFESRGSTIKHAEDEKSGRQQQEETEIGTARQLPWIGNSDKEAFLNRGRAALGESATVRRIIGNLRDDPFVDHGLPRETIVEETRSETGHLRQRRRSPIRIIHPNSIPKPTGRLRLRNVEPSTTDKGK